VKTIRMLQIIGPAFAMAISGLAQETLNYGTISGVVTDPSGGVIDGAAIAARQTEINLRLKQPPMRRDASGCSISGWGPTRSRARSR